MQQLSFLSCPDPRPPETVTWNMHHGCTKVSYGCQHCYMFRRDEAVGKDPTKVVKTQNFNLPVRRLRSGPHRGTRSDCTFFMITKRPERISAHLPYDAYDWDHVTIAVTCENQWAADKRLPIYLALPLRHHSVMIEPMLSSVNLRPYFEGTKDGRGIIEEVSVGGESGPDARPCDYSWVLDMHVQCVENGVAFSYHQTGARLIKGGKEYNIPRELQHDQARKAGLDFDGVNFPQCCS